jgi:predicted permease
MDEIHTDWRVLAFALGITLLAGTVLGMVPALRMRNTNLDETLKQGGRSQSSGAAAKRIRSGLVVAQVGMTIVLLIAAALLGRSFVNLLQVNLGFQTENRIDLQTSFLSPQGSAARKAGVLKIEQILDQIRTTPGVLAGAAVRGLPLADYNTNGRFTLEDGTTSGDYWPVYNAATPGYFEAVGIPLIRGRFFNDKDGPDSPEVAVVSHAVANHVWPGQDPLGKRINYGNMDGDEHYTTVIGVAGDIRNNPAEALQGTIYVNFLQRGARNDFDFVIRGTGDAENLGRTLAAEIRKADPEASVRIKTFDQLFSSNLADRRFNLALLGSFGATALLLALMGIYAVASYSVAQRTQEIGIRMALGADAGAVARLFLSEGTRLVVGGVILGMVGALVTSRVLASFLFNIRPTDSLAFLIAIAPMIVTALIANFLPARRAAKVNPALTIQQHY